MFNSRQHSVSVQQKGTEGVVVAVVITEEAALIQAHRHLVPGLQVEGHHRGAAVLLILLVFLAVPSDLQAVHLQTSTGRQFGVGGTGIAVDGERQTVDPRARNGEDPGALVVAVTVVDEGVFVGHNLMGAEGAEAFQTLLRVKRDRHGDVVGWRRR